MRYLLLSLSLALTACSARRNPVFTDGFRLARINGESKLLAPSVAEAHPPTQPVQLAVGRPRGRRDSCSEDTRLFRFTAARNSGLTARVAAPAAAEAPEAIQQDLDTMLSRLDALEARGCLARGQAASVGNLMEDTLAVRPNQALFYRLHYRPEGLMDLLPGVGVKVERAWFRAAENGQVVKDLRHYVGVGTHHYEIARDTRGRLAFHLTSAERSGPLPAAPGLPDGKLAAALKPMPFARLFLLGEAVARRMDRVAMIVGASSRERLSAATAMIREKPDIGCAPALLALGASCVTFDGSVVVSPEIRVFRQGAEIHTTAGIELRNLPGLPAGALATLRVERLFHGSYYPVRFASGDAAILTLSLASGDRIDW